VRRETSQRLNATAKFRTAVARNGSRRLVSASGFVALRYQPGPTGWHASIFIPPRQRRVVADDFD